MNFNNNLTYDKYLIKSIYMNCIDLKRLKWGKSRNSFGTPGSFLKAYEIRNNKKVYYKLSNYDTQNGIIGHECINEIIVDRLLNILCIDHLSYKLLFAEIDINSILYKTYLCSSEDFKDKNEIKMPIDDYYELNKQDNETRLEFANRIGYIDYVYLMFVVDFIIINRDRHGANIEILKNTKNNSIRLSPLFDHGMSLIFSCKDDNEIKKFNILEDRKVQSYFGNDSLFDNLKLIPTRKLPKIKHLSLEDKEYIFKDIDHIMSKIWIEKVWNLLNERINYYEHYRNKR